MVKIEGYRIVRNSLIAFIHGKIQTSRRAPFPNCAPDVGVNDNRHKTKAHAWQPNTILSAGT